MVKFLDLRNELNDLAFQLYLMGYLDAFMQKDSLTKEELERDFVKPFPRKMFDQVQKVVLLSYLKGWNEFKNNKDQKTKEAFLFSIKQ